MHPVDPFRQFQDHVGQLPAAVHRAFIVAQDLIETDALLQRTGPVLQTAVVMLAHLLAQVVHHTGQHHDLPGDDRLLRFKDGTGHVHRLIDGGLCHRQFPMGPVGEVHSLLVQFPQGMGHVHGIVGDPFEIRDGVKHQGRFLVLLIIELMTDDLHQIIAQCVLIGIAVILHLCHFLKQLLGIALQHLSHVPDPFRCHFRHTEGNILDLGQCQGGIFEEPVFQQSQCGKRFFLHFRRSDNDPGDPHQRGDQRHQYDDGKETEYGVYQGDAHRIHEGIGECQMVDAVDDIEQRHAQCGAADIHDKMHERGTYLVCPAAQHAEEHRDRPAYRDAHHDGKGGGKGHDPGHAQCLHDAHRGRRGLDNGGEYKSHRKAQQRIGEVRHEVQERLIVLQRLHRGAHGGHPGHEDDEAQQEISHVILFYAFAEFPQKDPGDGNEGRQIRHGQDIRQPSGGTDGGQTDDPAGDTASQDGAQDHVRRLPQFHHAGVQETDGDDTGGRGGLDDGAEHGSDEHALEWAADEPGQDRLEFSAGDLIKSVAQKGHAVEEQRQPAQKGQHHSDTHIDTPACYKEIQTDDGNRPFRPSILLFFPIFIISYPAPGYHYRN